MRVVEGVAMRLRDEEEVTQIALHLNSKIEGEKIQ